MDTYAEKEMHVGKTGGLKACPNESRGYAFVKRGFDITASLAALIILSPVLLLTAVAVYIDDPGPVIYSNELVGKGGKPFRILKFRSMYRNAAEIAVSAHADKGDASVTFKLANDPRVTRVGRFIRRACIDELPQLVNILRGERDIIETTKKSTGFSRVVVTGSISLCDFIRD